MKVAGKGFRALAKASAPLLFIGARCAQLFKAAINKNSVLS
jgi:hypothetical protein